MKRWLCSAALALSCPVDAVEPDAEAGMAALVSQARSAITRDFLDPGAAQFRDEVIYRKLSRDGLPYFSVCGQVNGKNQMGGYVGFKPYHYSASQSAPMSEVWDGKDKSFAIFHTLLCQDTPEPKAPQ